MTKQKKIIIDLRTQSQIETRCWVFDGEVFVVWADAMIVYPDFGGTNAK